MISIDSLMFGYNRKPLFQDLDLTLETGNIYGLLGLNGAGKTTLLKLLSGLLFADSGRVEVFGHDPVRRSPELLRGIFMLTEELYLPSVTDKEYLLTHAPFYPAFDFERFEGYLQEFEHPRGQKLSKISYGQKKKFLLSFGLACGSSLLLLDEPGNGLDIPAKSQFRRVMAEIFTQERIVIISTHQVRDVDSLIDPVVILHEGRVVFNHAMADLSKRIHMTRSPGPPPADAEGLIYTEASVGGHWSVWRGPDESGGPVDLEVLFNTVISRPDVYEEIFAKKESSV